MKFFDVAIIGGGASGLACASRLAELNKNLQIAVIDAGERLGKKLASTGNGQGNVTNKNMNIEHYFSENLQLVESIACASDKINLEERLFKCMLVADEQGRVYPGGKQASSLCDSLIADLKRAGVEVLLSTKVMQIKKNKNFELVLNDNSKIFAKYAVLCVGGKAQKQFKTDGFSYALARSFGHTLTKLYPSLVQLKTDTTHIKTLKGIRADCNLTAMVDGKIVAKKRGDIIFTDYGVSGNAVFYVSAFIADKQNVSLSVEFLPEISGIEEDIKRKKTLKYDRNELLSGTLHNQIGRAIIKRCDSDDEKIIANTVKNFTIKVVGSLGFDYAQVTKGGVKMQEVTSELESKFEKNLFLAGEVLDVDGECGGYNLHWAFASGYAVAEAIAKREK